MCSLGSRRGCNSPVPASQLAATSLHQHRYPCTGVVQAQRDLKSPSSLLWTTVSHIFASPAQSPIHLIHFLCFLPMPQFCTIQYKNCSEEISPLILLLFFSYWHIIYVYTQLQIYVIFLTCSPPISVSFLCNLIMCLAVKEYKTSFYIESEILKGDKPKKKKKQIFRWTQYLNY